MPQLLVNMLALGSAYALMAMGFVLILNATNAVNFAHGNLVMLGSYVALTLGGMVPVPGLMLLPLLFVVMAAVGFVLAAVAFFPLRDQPVVAVFISTLSAGAIMENGALAAYGPEAQATPTMLGRGLLNLAGVQVSVQALAVIGIAGLLVLGQWLLFSHTRLGKRLRAAAQDPDMAAACGMNVKLMVALTFGIASALAGAAGMFLSASYFVSPSDGANYTMKAYIAVTIGGWGSIPGAVAGAMLVALFEVLIPAVPVLFPGIGSVAPGASALFTGAASTMALFAVFLLVLMVRPQGLFGEAVLSRA